MSETLFTIEAKLRTKTGKSVTRKIRRAGFLPGVVLEKGKSTMIELDPKLLSKAYKSGKIFNLSLEGQIKKVEIKELQVDHVKRLPVHIDLVYAS